MIITDSFPIGNRAEPQKHKNQALTLASPGGWISPARPFIPNPETGVNPQASPGGWECAARRFPSQNTKTAQK